MDERAASPVAHWGPRFTGNGVTVADCERVTAGVQTRPERHGAWLAPGPRSSTAASSWRTAGGAADIVAPFLIVFGCQDRLILCENAVRCATPLRTRRAAHAGARQPLRERPALAPAAHRRLARRTTHRTHSTQLNTKAG